MSGFDPDWLALREPADAAARNRAVLDACAAYFVDAESVVVVDLGCGAGSNLRALAPRLPRLQKWRLVDNDSRLLAAARQRLIDWADAHADAHGVLHLEKDGKTIDVDFARADLARGSDVAIGESADLVTAAALFDLTSEDWMNRLCGLLARRRLPLYAVLTYNGAETWTPPHASDESMRAAFHAHQAGDKGFGPSAGPRAATVLRRLLQTHGFRVREGASDWSLGAHDAALVASLASGIAGACRETGLVDEAAAGSWLQARRAASARIGHDDLFATPP